MSKITSLSCMRLFTCFFSSFSLLLITGLADTSSTSNNEKGSTKSPEGSGSTWLKFIIIFFGILAVGAFSVFLFKLWQRKKREEQHARLLKLFEQDDELEVELGIRD